jgi:soluble lytic murein transglycosylase-like protein
MRKILTILSLSVFLFLTGYLLGSHSDESNESPILKNIKVPKEEIKYPTRVSPLQHVIYIKSKKYNLDPKLIKSIISHESRWKKYAKGKSNDLGLMQVLTINMTNKERLKPYDYENNVEAGARYLSKCIRKYGENNMAISCYNTGLNGRYNPKYVEAVLSYYRK